MYTIECFFRVNYYFLTCVHSALWSVLVSAKHAHRIVGNWKIELHEMVGRSVPFPLSIYYITHRFVGSHDIVQDVD